MVAAFLLRGPDALLALGDGYVPGVALAYLEDGFARDRGWPTDRDMLFGASGLC
jgi:hypothetical protein